VDLLRRRLSELDTERDQIVAALRALEGASANRASSTPARRTRQRRRSASTTRSSASPTRATRARASTTRATGRQASAKPTRGRRGGGNTQADRFLKLVTDNPGITVAQAASKMGMPRANALYSVASRLSREGKVAKRGTGYHAA